ncbi:MAG: tol-pal system protein YbgF [Betaproteobacteria bacterium]|nr:MAG: tol-pal system protein YbgF [Betaproteobacteria bacterium]
MNSSDLNLRCGIRLAALLLALVTAPVRADDVPAPIDDTNAYQLLQLLNQNEALSAEISSLRGQIEELVESAERARKSQEKIAVDFDARIATIEAKPDVDTSEEKARIATLESRIRQLEDALNAMHEVVKTATQAPIETNTTETVYESALEKYRDGEYEAAVLDFQAFLQLYGDDPLSLNARYWLAEALLREGSYDNAIETGEMLLIDHPESQKAPDTMFLLGKAYLEKGDASGARGALEDLVATYPDSNPATKAQGLLDQLP